MSWSLALVLKLLQVCQVLENWHSIKHSRELESSLRNRILELPRFWSSHVFLLMDSNAGSEEMVIAAVQNICDSEEGDAFFFAFLDKVCI